MGGKSLRDTVRSAWKLIAAIFVVISGLASLQTLGLLSVLVRNVILFLMISLPIWIIILVSVALVSIFLLAGKSSRGKQRGISSILELEDARRLVTLCTTPRTTAFLKSEYERWQRESSVVVLGGMRFDDYMKSLEKEGHLAYSKSDGTWSTNSKTLAIVEKYHGDVYRTKSD